MLRCITSVAAFLLKLGDTRPTQTRFKRSL